MLIEAALGDGNERAPTPRLLECRLVGAPWGERGMPGDIASPWLYG